MAYWEGWKKAEKARKRRQRVVLMLEALSEADPTPEESHWDDLRAEVAAARSGAVALLPLLPEPE